MTFVVVACVHNLLSNLFSNEIVRSGLSDLFNLSLWSMFITMLYDDYQKLKHEK